MWGRKRKAERQARAEFAANSIAEAQTQQVRAQLVIDHVERHAPEVDELVGRLKDRATRNNFGESLTRAMERRATT